MIIQHLETSIKSKQLELNERLAELTEQLNQHQTGRLNLHSISQLKLQTEEELKRLAETLKLISN
ncbi:hypothetical protein [Thalassotalea aquiviva]|uniref:hypothetical protein n=1 Tax=Thalassotalea aquiviva TaxID=3242415 RepID=UPI003529EEFC